MCGTYSSIVEATEIDGEKQQSLRQFIKSGTIKPVFVGREYKNVSIVKTKD